MSDNLLNVNRHFLTVKDSILIVWSSSTRTPTRKTSCVATSNLQNCKRHVANISKLWNAKNIYNPHICCTGIIGWGSFIDVVNAYMNCRMAHGISSSFNAQASSTTGSMLLLAQIKCLIRSRHSLTHAQLMELLDRISVYCTIRRVRVMFLFDEDHWSAGLKNLSNLTATTRSKFASWYENEQKPNGVTQSHRNL